MATRKNPAAVSLGRKGGEARRNALTPEQRSASARHAVLSRYGKTKPPARWYGVVLIPIPEDLHGGMRKIAKILDDAHADPNVVLWTQDRDEARARARQENLAGRWAEIVDVPYDPNRLSIQREYRPDPGAQVKGLRAVLDGGQS